LQALIINEFEGETFTCDDPVPQDADPGVTSTGCIRTGEQEIAMLSFQVSAAHGVATALPALVYPERSPFPHVLRPLCVNGPC
jgi:hypothetical protein